MRKLIVLLLFFVAAGSLSVACGDDDSDNASSVSREQLPQEFAEAICARVFSCCTAQEYPEAADAFDTQQFSTEEECRAGISAQLEAEFQSSQDKAIAAGRLEYRADRAGKCVSLFQDTACGKGLLPVGSEAQNACDEVFAGKVEAGGECTSSNECLVGECFGVEQSEEDGSITKMGTCNAPADTGEACDNFDCKEGNYCEHQYDPETQSTSGICKKIAQIGEACTSFECVGGSYCDIDLSSGSTEGTCKALKSEGEACDYGECNEDTYCGGEATVGADRTCMKYKSAGEACTSSDECSSYRCEPPAEDEQGQKTCQGGGGQICTGA